MTILGPMLIQTIVAHELPTKSTQMYLRFWVVTPTIVANSYNHKVQMIFANMPFMLREEQWVITYFAKVSH
jgi:hypothetical protein